MEGGVLGRSQRVHRPADWEGDKASPGAVIIRCLYSAELSALAISRWMTWPAMKTSTAQVYSMTAVQIEKSQKLLAQKWMGSGRLGDLSAFVQPRAVQVNS